MDSGKKSLGCSNASFSDFTSGLSEQRQTAHGQVGWKIPTICPVETQEKCPDKISVLWSQQGHCTNVLNAHEWTLKARLVL